MRQSSGVSGQNPDTAPTTPESVSDTTVPSLGTALARAVLDGDIDRARELAAAIVGSMDTDAVRLRAVG
jgi:hypothetical protein